MASTRAFRLPARRNAGSCHQGQPPDALGVIGSNDREQTRHTGAVTELPDDLVGLGIHLNNAVVELVGDQNVSAGIKSPTLRAGVLAGGQHYQSGAGQQPCKPGHTAFRNLTLVYHDLLLLNSTFPVPTLATVR